MLWWGIDARGIDARGIDARGIDAHTSFNSIQPNYSHLNKMKQDQQILNQIWFLKIFYDCNNYI